MLTRAQDLSPEGARERARETSRDRAPETRLVAVVVPARPLPAGTVLCARERMPDVAPSVAWVPSESDDDAWSFVGWGTAARVDGHGDERLAQVREGAARLFRRIDGAGALPFAPRLFGGFAFAAERDVTERDATERNATERGARGNQGHTSQGSALARAWRVFPDASFVLPHILYARNADRAFLAAFVAEEEAPRVAGALGEVRRLLDGMASLEGSPPERTTLGAVRVAFGAPGATPPAGAAAPRTASGGSSNGHDDETSEIAARRAWTGLVTRALSEIDRGTFAKVVLSRTRHLAGSRDLDPRRAFAFVEPRHPACARFLFARDGATFLGASPERLLSVRGRRALTEALAGSIPRRATGDDDRARRELLASGKDRAEHAFVVSAIRASLAPLCEALVIPEEPHVRSLAHVHHLATPITATLRDHAHLLDLAARLHPTPALCGSPTDAARDFILAGEPDPRGWYGGAVGWLDANGDGTLAVAIRSAIVTPADAWIHAGAGIVRGSEPEQEYIETTIKERAMRDALEAAS